MAWLASLATFAFAVCSPRLVPAALAQTDESAVLSPAQRMAAGAAGFSAATTPVARLVALYRIEETAPLLPAAAVAATLERLEASDQLDPLLRAEIDSQRAALDLREGNGAGAAEIWTKLGEVENWQAVGPFDNASPAAIEQANGPEKNAPAIDLSAHYQGKLRSVSWRPIPFSRARGQLDLAAYLSPTKSVSAYLVSWVQSDAARTVALRLRDDGSTRVWVNGQPVFDEQATHASSSFDQHAAAARLEPGWNEILAKVGDTETADWRFSLRLTTPEGEPIVLASTATAPATEGARAGTEGRGTPGGAALGAPRDLTALAQAAGGLDYAWVLAEKQNFDAGSHLDSNAFLAAIAALPDGAARRGAMLDFVEHDRDLSRRYQNLEAVLAEEATNQRARLDLSEIEVSRQEYWPARSDAMAVLGMTATDAIAPASAIEQAPEAAMTMFLAFRGSGVRAQSVEWAEAMRAAGATGAPLSGTIAFALQRMGLQAEALRWFEAAHGSDAGNLTISLGLADAQRTAGDLTAALATVRAAAGLDGDVPSLLEAEARALAGLDRAPEALASIDRAVTLAPDTPTLRIAQGEIQRLLGHATESAASWQAALALNPQDNDLRDRLQLARGGETAVASSFERPYTQDLQQAMAAFKAKDSPALESGPVVILADTNVVNIFPSGNTGRYVQQIFRINNSSGADSLSVYSVTYDPAAEDVRFLTARVLHADGTSADAPEAGDQPISESVGYETFYNVRNKFVQMPPMRAGDFVEIAYRVLPTTLESLYGDYFGDLDPFGSSAPTLFQQYVVITPANKPLYFKAIRFAGQGTHTTADGQTVYRWSARDLPAQLSEPLAPPSIEQSPYIAVSSFETWDQFGRWYTQLIRDTFVMDDEMVQTVNGLVKGKTTEQDKVDAIYRWVIQNTHYVALEFGIHGYRPYPVTEVFHRRFGDCKDKASLLIAMLHQAGIESDFVLVRVRELGVIDPTIPAVADFDHAIVYVPSLHRYLDGTAEYNGADELPGGDQRAFVLRIPVHLGGAASEVRTSLATTPAGAGGANGELAPEVTPEQPATANVSTRVLNGQIEPSGDLRFSMVWTLEGGRAPVFRASLEIPERRAGALQAMLHDRLPGITVVRAEVEHEDDWDQPIVVSLDGVIPRFATVNGSSLLIPRQILPTSWLPQMASLATRQYDLLTDPPEILQETMHLALPPGYAAVLPGPSHDDQPFASFDATASMNGTTLTLASRIETKKALIPPSVYPAFRTFWAGVDGALGRAIPSRSASVISDSAGGGQ